MTYRTIVADPPWQYTKNNGNRNRTAEAHYDTMPLSRIAAMPVVDLAADEAHLYLWVTNKVLTEQRVDGTALQIVKAWGFQPKAILTWVKPGMGMGFYFRGATEHVIFATRGKAPIPPALRERNVFEAPRGRHSAKPQCFYDLAERVSPGPYVELFARSPRPGWHVWGNEVTSDLDLAA